MLKRVRKSSSRITLVLIGVASLGGLAGCNREETRRDLYASKEACLSDWGNSPKDCEPAYDQRTGSANRTFYYGRPYLYTGGGSMFGSTGTAHSSHAMSSTSVSRGGFGSSGHSSSAGG